MQAIQTKYFGPTNYRGARIKATCAARSISMPYGHALNVEDNHIKAASILVSLLKWDDAKEYQGLATGQIKDGTYVHVLIHTFSEVRKGTAK